MPSAFDALDEMDRGEMVALTLYEADLCQGCGQPRTVSMDPALKRDWVTPPPFRCHACEALNKQRDGYAKQLNPEALQFGVHLDHHK